MNHDPRRPGTAAAPEQTKPEPETSKVAAPKVEPGDGHSPGALPPSEFGPRRAPERAPDPPKTDAKADAGYESKPAPPAQAAPAASPQPLPQAAPPAAPGKPGFDPQGVAGTFPAPAPAKSSWRRKLLLACLALLFLAGAAAGYIAFEANNFLNNSPRTLAPEETVEVEILRGDTFGKVAKRLEDAGLISNALYFRLYAMWEGRTASIQAGIFEFSNRWTPQEVLHHLVFGHPVLYRLTIREGLPWWEVAKLAEENGFATAEDFKTVIHDPEFLTKHGIPFTNAEGFLFPDTYFLRKPKAMDKAAALALANRLVDTFQNKTKELFAGQDITADKLKEIVILASMVEKETSIADERPIVAGVFANRIRLGMLMQCDPTIIYGLGEKFNGNIRKSDLEDDSNLYNTYRHAGLPPGPICSPGYAAIAAAVRPAAHDYLYFVATKAGGEHIFNASLKDHINAVNKDQRGRNN